SPFHSEKMKMMDCCEKAKDHDGSPVTSMARLCCALNCNDSAPTSSSFSANLSSSSQAIENSVASQISDLFKTARNSPPVEHSYQSPIVSTARQSKYIQYHSFLI
ncbi:MAG: hypothetical protein ABI999_02055, partial [Acidobacteriota bacterium]